MVGEGKERRGGRWEVGNPARRAALGAEREQVAPTREQIKREGSACLTAL